jgi:hypothetical protein
MSTYYCHRCARRAGHVTPVTPPAAPGGQYQLDKYVKHTQPTGVYPVNSVFADPSWGAYQNHLVAAAASGCLEIDTQGRKNLIFFAGEQTGLRYDNGHFTAPCSGVKVVCGEDAAKVHGFPSDFQPESRACATCGEPVPFDPRTYIDLELL